MFLRAFGRAMVVALVALSFMAVAPVSAASTFTDAQGRFSFTVPDGYAPLPDFVKPPVVAAFTSTNPPGPNFTVQVRDARGTLDVVVANLRQEYITGPGATAGANPQSFTLGGQPAQRYDFFQTTDNSRFHIAQVMTIKDASLYLLTFTAQEQSYDTLLSQTAIVLSSFSFGGTPSAAPAPGAKPGGTINDNTFIGQGGLYSFTIPKGFTQGAPTGEEHFDVLFEVRDGGGLRAVFAAEAFTVSATPPLDTVAQAIRDLSKGYTYVSDQPITFGNLPGRRLDGTTTINDIRLHVVDLITVKDRTIYYIDFFSPDFFFDQYEQAISTLITSFNVSGVSGQQPATTPPTTSPPTTTPTTNTSPPSSPPSQPSPPPDPKGGAGHD